MHHLSLDLSSLFLKAPLPLLLANTFVGRCTFLTGTRYNVTRSARYAPNNLFAGPIVIEASLFLANSVFFCTRKRGRKSRIQQHAGIYTDRPSPKMVPDISGLYFRHGSTRHGSSTILLSLSYFHSRTRRVREYIKARQSQNTINVGIE